jgi:hypothetical protein
MERGRNRRKNVHLSCTLEFYSGVSGYGHTYNLSFDGALVRCDGIAIPGRPSPKLGDPAIFGFSFRNGSRVETLKVACRLAHMDGNCLGLQLFTAGMIKGHQALLLQLLDA